jgi:hypothetical protein
MSGLQNFGLLLLGGICVLFLSVIAVRFFAALKIRRWTPAHATILISEPRARRPGESGPETVPHIEYEYSADGRTWRSHQLKPPNVPLGETDLPHFLGRYPVGASAQIYYHPDNPQLAVLEREPLSLSAKRFGCLSVFAAAVLLALIYGLTPLYDLIHRWFPHVDNEEVLVLTTALGVYLLLFGLMWLIDGLRQRNWPEVNGIVVSSTVESFKTMVASKGGNTHMKMYRAAVIYTYEAGGRQYRSSQIRREKVSGAEELAKAVVEKYPAGSSVRVHYNPDNPADAVLETSTLAGFVLLWILALAMFGVAASVSGYFRHPH